MPEDVVDIETVPQVSCMWFDVGFFADDGKLGGQRDAKGQLDPFRVCESHFGLWW